MGPRTHTWIVSCQANVNLRFALHFGLIFYANVDMVSFLLKSSADINEQLEVPMKKTGWWMLLKFLALRHRVSPSALTYLAYHHSGATPLMLSIITAKFDCASLLLASGARVDLKNRRGKTAADMVRETGAPISLRPAPKTNSERIFEIWALALLSTACPLPSAACKVWSQLTNSKCRQFSMLWTEHHIIDSS